MPSPKIFRPISARPAVTVTVHQGPVIEINGGDADDHERLQGIQRCCIHRPENAPSPPNPQQTPSPLPMNKSVLALLGTFALIPGFAISVGLPAQALPIPASSDCSPVNGQWFFGGTPGPIITQSRDRLSVDMSAYGRPAASGRLLSDSTLEVTFPDDATFTGTLDGRGRIRWNNGTLWEARDFSGTWNFSGRPGPVISQSGARLSVNMSAYGRPTASGTTITPTLARVTFPDDGTFTATLVSPSCIRWSNRTIWTK